MHARSIAGSAFLIAVAASSALGQGLGNRDAGERLATLYCAQCHGDVDTQDGAPPFETIANTPWLTADALNLFLQTPHAANDDVVANAEDRNDLIAYILSLRP